MRGAIRPGTSRTIHHAKLLQFSHFVANVCADLMAVSVFSQLLSFLFCTQMSNIHGYTRRATGRGFAKGNTASPKKKNQDYATPGGPDHIAVLARMVRSNCLARCLTLFIYLNISLYSCICVEVQDVVPNLRCSDMDLIGAAAMVRCVCSVQCLSR